jgi:hypothetical protein
MNSKTTPAKKTSNKSRKGNLSKLMFAAQNTEVKNEGGGVVSTPVETAVKNEEPEIRHLEKQEIKNKGKVPLTNKQIINKPVKEQQYDENELFIEDINPVTDLIDLIDSKETPQEKLTLSLKNNHVDFLNYIDGVIRIPLSEYGKKNKKTFRTTPAFIAINCMIDLINRGIIKDKHIISYYTQIQRKKEIQLERADRFIQDQ